MAVTVVSVSSCAGINAPPLPLLTVYKMILLTYALMSFYSCLQDLKRRNGEIRRRIICTRLYLS